MPAKKSSRASAPRAGKSPTATSAARSSPKKPLAKAAGRAAAAPKPAGGGMTFAAVMKALEKGGSEPTRTTYARHGATGAMFGVRFGDLFGLMKTIGVDHALARELWATGNVDARNLAMKIADPAEITPAELDRWTVENPMPMCALYIATLAVESGHGRSRLKEWLGASDERLRAMGWTLLARLADLDAEFPDDELVRRLGEIETSIHSAPNRVRAEMNRALISIGGRSPALRKAAGAAAKRIGRVTVDHGDTACKTADAVETIEKMWARSGAKYGSPAAHERALGSMRRRC